MGDQALAVGASRAPDLAREIRMTDTITPETLRFERRLDAPVETVWGSLVDP